MSSIIQQLEWRYATHEFDTAKKLSTEQEHTVLEALRLAPSSFGLQPWKFIVITDPAIRAKLREQAWGQAQITDASHLVVLCSVKNLDKNYVDHYIDFISQERGIAKENLQNLHNMIMGSIESKNPEGLKSWAQKQVYIALGVLLTTCAIEHIDACPMEGFSPEGFDQILGLDQQGLQSTVLCAIGFRKEDDKASLMKKVRFPASEVIIKRS